MEDNKKQVEVFRKKKKIRTPVRAKSKGNLLTSIVIKEDGSVCIKEELAEVFSIWGGRKDE